MILEDIAHAVRLTVQELHRQPVRHGPARRRARPGRPGRSARQGPAAHRAARARRRTCTRNRVRGVQGPRVRARPAAAIARSEAAFAKYEEGEAAFEAQNGFRRKVNAGALGSYAKALSGNFGVPAFASAGEAADYAEYTISSMTSNASTIKSSVFEAQSLAKPEVAAFYGETTTGQLRAKHADTQKAAEMDLFVLNAVLTRAFGLSSPVTRQDGGDVTFVAQDITWNGRAIARLAEDGVLTRLGADGTPATVNRRA